MRQSMLRQGVGGIAIGLLLTVQPGLSIAGSLNPEKAVKAKTTASAPARTTSKIPTTVSHKPKEVAEQKPIARYWGRIMAAVREVQQAQSAGEAR